MESLPKLCICLIADLNYLKYAAFLVKILRTIDPKIEQIFVLTTNVSNQEFIDIFKDISAKQIQVDMSELLELGIVPQGHVSTATYLKLLIADLLPQEFSRCLYLDIDILPLRSIENLLRFPLNRPVAATQFSNGESRRLFNSDDATYFSAGLMLIDLEFWRTEKIGSKLVDLLRENPKLFQGDNDLLNIFFRENWQPLPLSMNFMAEPLLNGYLVDKGISPMIIHFVGPRKPWTKNGRTKWHKLWRDLYRQYDPSGFEKATSDAFLYRKFLSAARSPFIAPFKSLLPYKLKEAFLRFGER